MNLRLNCVAALIYLSLASAPSTAIFFGEIALSAELRQVAQAETRLKEAEIRI